MLWDRIPQKSKGRACLVNPMNRWFFQAKIFGPIGELERSGGSPLTTLVAVDLKLYANNFQCKTWTFRSGEGTISHHFFWGDILYLVLTQ